uniref:Uncharacterized protein n=1 Tax=Caenorhabditis japonica TaxID=281687 RepID=A0A8R1HVS7_CAEJA
MFRSILFVSAFLVVAAYCGYPVAENTYPTPPSYVLPKKYPVAPTYPVQPSYPSAPVEYAQKPSYSAPPPPPAPVPSGYSSSSDNVFSGSSDSEYSTAAPNAEYRQRAKARTTHNRQFQRRSLEPIRRFQQKQ